MDGGIQEAIAASFHDGIYKCILSNQVSKAEGYRKIVLNRLQGCFQLEKYTEKQVFHEKLTQEQVPGFLCDALQGHFRQYNGWDAAREYQIRISAKGKVLCSRKAVPNKAPQAAQSHNRKKRYLLEEGTVIQPLVDLGVFTKEGKVVHAMYDKYKQINRFLEMVDDVSEKLPQQGPLRVIDFGCGKSYLTFILYHYLTEVKKRAVQMVGLDLKAEVIQQCNQTALKYGYDGLHFELGDINGYRLTGGVDLVITLHACDTATDYALFNAVSWGARVILSVLCCQHELNGQMQSERLAILTRYGIVKERTAALMTDAIRANLLECCGYRTQLLEFIDLAHTPKNILIRAVKRAPGEKAPAGVLKEARALMEEFSLSPTLYRLLEEAGKIPDRVQ